MQKTKNGQLFLLVFVVVIVLVVVVVIAWETVVQFCSHLTVCFWNKIG